MQARRGSGRRRGACPARHVPAGSDLDHPRGRCGHEPRQRHRRSPAPPMATCGWSSSASPCPFPIVVWAQRPPRAGSMNRLPVDHPARSGGARARSAGKMIVHDVTGRVRHLGDVPDGVEWALRTRRSPAAVVLLRPGSSTRRRGDRAARRPGAETPRATRRAGRWGQRAWSGRIEPIKSDAASTRRSSARFKHADQRRAALKTGDRLPPERDLAEQVPA